MTRELVEQLAAAREQFAVHVVVLGRDRWLLCDKLPCRLSDLAQSLNGDAYALWSRRQLQVTDVNGKAVIAATVDDWRRREPLHFRRRDAKLRT